MPYITTDKVKEIRNNLKKALPGIKLSVRRESHSSLVVSVMKSKFDFGTKYKQLNPYYPTAGYENNADIVDALTTIMDTINETHEQREIVNDADYGSVPNYYINLHIGKWDKPYVMEV